MRHLKVYQEKQYSLRVNSKPSHEGARDMVIKTISQQQEMRLRHLEWIESNRKKVETLSNGQLGYMYMPNTVPMDKRNC
jgi:tricorn protease